MDSTHALPKQEEITTVLTLNNRTRPNNNFGNRRNSTHWVGGGNIRSNLYNNTSASIPTVNRETIVVGSSPFPLAVQQVHPKPNFGDNVTVRNLSGNNVVSRTTTASTTNYQPHNKVMDFIREHAKQKEGRVSVSPTFSRASFWGQQGSAEGHRSQIEYHLELINQLRQAPYDQAVAAVIDQPRPIALTTTTTTQTTPPPPPPSQDMYTKLQENENKNREQLEEMLREAEGKIRHADVRWQQRLEAMESQQEENVNALQKLVDDLQSQRDEHLRGRQRAEAQVVTLTAQLEELGLKARKAEQSEAMEARLEAALAQLRHQEDDIQHRVEDFEDRINAIQALREKEREDAADLAALYAASKRELSEVHNQWDAAAADGKFTDEELQQLRESHENNALELAQVKQDLLEMRREHEETVQVLAQKEEEIAVLRANWEKDMSTAAHEASTAAEEAHLLVVQQLNEENENLRVRVMELTGELNVQALQERMKDESLVTDDGSDKATRVKAEDSPAPVDPRYEELKKEITEIRDALANATKFKEQHDKLIKELVEVSAERDISLQEFIKMRHNLTMAIQGDAFHSVQLSQMRAVYQTLSQEFADAKRDQKRLAAEVLESRAALDRATQETATLRQELISTKQNYDVFRSRLVTSEAERNSKELEVNALKDANQLLQLRLQQTASERDQSAFAAQEEARSTGSAQQELIRMQSLVDTLRQETIGLKQQLDMQVEEGDGLRSQRARAETDAHRGRQAVEALRRDQEANRVSIFELKRHLEENELLQHQKVAGMISNLQTRQAAVDEVILRNQALEQELLAARQRSTNSDRETHQTNGKIQALEAQLRQLTEVNQKLVAQAATAPDRDNQRYRLIQVGDPRLQQQQQLLAQQHEAAQAYRQQTRIPVKYENLVRHVATAGEDNKAVNSRGVVLSPPPRRL